MKKTGGAIPGLSLFSTILRLLFKSYSLFQGEFINLIPSPYRAASYARDRLRQQAPRSIGMNLLLIPAQRSRKFGDSKELTRNILKF